MVRKLVDIWLGITFGLLLVVMPESVYAHHYTFVTQDPNQQYSNPPGANLNYKENHVFNDYYINSFLAGSISMRVNNELGTDGGAALATWFSLLSTNMSSNLTYQLVLPNQNPNVTITHDDASHSHCGGAAGCLRPWDSTWAPNSSWGTNSWYRATIYLNPSYTWETPSLPGKYYA